MQHYLANFDVEEVGREFARVRSFDQAYSIMKTGRIGPNTTMHHDAYVPFPKINDRIMSVMDDGLNDDCIRRVIAFLDLNHLTSIAEINEHFHSLASEKFKNVNLSLSTLGSPIDLINLRYIFHLFGESMLNLSFSMDSIRVFLFGHHNCFKRYAVLSLIRDLAGPNLKSITLKASDFSNKMDSNQMEQDLIERMKNNGKIQINFV